MTSLLGQKVGMTRVVDTDGSLVGATVIVALPNAIAAVRTKEKDGYSAIQLGYGDPAKAKKPQQGRLAKAKAKAGRYLVEVRLTDETQAPALGAEVTVATFKPGDVVNVTATSKGRGFAGTVKRHHFAQGPRSHGSMNVRQPGSIGAQQPQRVILGKRMAGRLGGERTTVKHLTVLDVLPEQHLIVLKGAVPGIRGALLKLSRSPRHMSQASEELA
ncbi:50S ribosomal protein L3 [Candidatus Berkelbacteria bacterium]|nr:50S ribosomal protein L3 [Candidatus Berkelbacteria bacterium]